MTIRDRTVSDQKRDVCAVIVTYEPDNALPDRLESLVPQVGGAVIVDNGSEGPARHLLQQAAARFGIHLIRNEKNLGIATALNRGMRWAREHGYRWALTMDQDSWADKAMVETLLSVYGEAPNRDKIAVVGANYRTRKQPKKKRLPDGGNVNWCEVKAVITSGSLFSLRTYDKIGPFRDDFFIDHVDHEYCLRARSLGYRVLLSLPYVMEHDIGAPTSHRLLWTKTRASNHAPFRRYYQARNLILLARTYLREEPAWILATLWSLVKSSILICLFERDKTHKIHALVRGILDGLYSRDQYHDV